MDAMSAVTTVSPTSIDTSGAHVTRDNVAGLRERSYRADVGARALTLRSPYTPMVTGSWASALTSSITKMQRALSIVAPGGTPTDGNTIPITCS
eukprot:463463-Prymnesium_polylepis.2